MKYIVTQKADGTREIFLFQNTINHDCMAEVVNRIRDKTHGNWKREGRFPISAGFVSSALECYGRSESLDLDSDPAIDTALLRENF